MTYVSLCVCMNVCMCVYNNNQRRVHEFWKLGALAKLKERKYCCQCSVHVQSSQFCFKKCYKYNPVICTNPKGCSNDNQWTFKTIICDIFLDYGIKEN